MEDSNSFNSGKLDAPSLVSIIMPCYKMGRFIGEALESVGKQIYDRWEVLVVDDFGPEDGTSEAVENFARRYPTRRVDYVRLQENGGVSAARNAGVVRAHGEILAFLDPDDLWEPAHLHNGNAAIHSDLGADVVCAPVNVIDGTGKKIGFVAYFNDWQRRMFPASLACYNFIQPSAVIMRRHWFDLVGGFSTAKEIQHVEDYDLWIRLLGMNARFTLLDTPTCLYRRHENGATANHQKMRQLALECVRKHRDFFILMQSQLLAQTLELTFKSERRLAGPIMSRLHRVDQGLLKFKGWISRKKPPCVASLGG